MYNKEFFFNQSIAKTETDPLGLQILGCFGKCPIMHLKHVLKSAIAFQIFYEYFYANRTILLLCFLI